jgi:PPM family protein phosphatase
VTIGWEAAGATHVGRVRRGNEDAFRLDPEKGVFLVADGMGGHVAGEVASRLAADGAFATLLDHLEWSGSSLEHALRQSFQEAHRRIVDCCRGDPQTDGMGTTLTVSVLTAGGSVHVGHIGDSRLYHLRGGHLHQLTRDHTWVQQEVDAGRVARDAAHAHPLGHILTRVMSAEEPAEPDLSATVVAPGDMLLLCTDGLHNLVDPGSILELLQPDRPPEQLVTRLITAANRRGGTDNITAIVVRVR